MKNQNQKPVSLSKTENHHMVLPEHTNPMGNLFGGTLMSWIDETASIASFRHCRTLVVTASMDSLSFITPVKLGELVTLKSSVNYTSNRSIEVGVKVFAENPIKGEERHVASAYLTFVSLDKKGKAQPVPPVFPETLEEKKRYEAGRQRREERLVKRKGK